jgi:peptidoglycan hydrolase-like protein with peptidoglycan-binding domain
MPSSITPTQMISLDQLSQTPELAKSVQSHLARLGLLDPPADGQFGSLSRQALKEFQTLMNLSEAGFGSQTSQALESTKEAIPLRLGNDFGSRIIRYMKQKNYFVAVGKQKYNIVYVEGVDSDGRLNSDLFNEWNDRRLVIEIANGRPRIVRNWLATTEPGHGPTVRPSKAEGAARIAFGQYKAWQVGTHVGSSGVEPHEGLVQVAAVSVYRDRNKDGFRTGDAIDVGPFGINQHWGYDMPFVDGASAGCLVGQSRSSHKDFMSLIKQDRRYQLNNQYLFMTTIIAGDDLAAMI